MARLIPQLVQNLEQHHHALLAAVAAVPRELHDTLPPDGGWTIAQIIQHVAMIHAAIGKLLARSIEAAPAASDEPDPDRLINGRRMQAVLDRSVKVTSQESYVPTESLTSREALAKLETAFDNLVQVVRKAEGKALGEVRYPHYILGDLDLWQWIVFAGTHEGRHAQQVLDVGRALGCEPQI